MRELEGREDEVLFTDHLAAIMRRKWLVLGVTALCAVLAGAVSFLLPPKWEVDMLLVPSRFIVQTEEGQFTEVLVVEPKQVVASVNQKSYDGLIARKLNLDQRNFPEIVAENLRDTKLIKFSVRDGDVSRAMAILSRLFDSLKIEFDLKAKVQFKDIDTQIDLYENQVDYKALVMKDHLNDIKLSQIEVDSARQEIRSLEQKLVISEERAKTLLEEMKTARVRIADIEAQQKKYLAEKKEGAEAISALLYANETQNNLAYYNTLDEKLTMERISQENFRLAIDDRNDRIKQLHVRMDESRNEIEKVKIEVENFKSQIALLTERKARIDYTKVVKEPTPSLSPVSPRKARNVLVAALIGLLVSSIVAVVMGRPVKPGA